MIYGNYTSFNFLVKLIGNKKIKTQGNTLAIQLC